MKISLVVNFEKENAKAIALDAIDILKQYDVSICTDQITAQALGLNIFDVVTDIFSLCDMLLVIGGDGTIIHTAKKAALYNKPVLGINAGRIGYLASVKNDELQLISNIFTNEFTVDERIMLAVTVESQNGNKDFMAFNEAVVCKGSLSRMIDIDLELDKHSLRYRADGLIISTPTGSTAYSLSAGGPLLDPRLDSVLLTPICPYTYLNKAMVIPSSTNMCINVDIDGGKEAFLTVDGEVAVKIHAGEKIRIKKSDTAVKLICLKSESIFQRLEGKILKEVNK